METSINKAWKAKAKRTNPNIYYSDKAIVNPKATELICRAIGMVAMGIMRNCEIIHSEDKTISAHYDKQGNSIYIFQKGEQLQFNK